SLTGMEHTFQLGTALLYLHLVSKLDSPTKADLGRLVAASALITSVRYEGLAMVAVAVLLLFLRRQWLFAIAVIVAGVLPLAIYGIISVKNGSLWLPNSVLLKMTTPTRGIAPFIDALVGKIKLAPQLPLLILCACAMWFKRHRLNASFRDRRQLML